MGRKWGEKERKEVIMGRKGVKRGETCAKREEKG